MKGFKALYGVFAFIALLLLITPFARVYQVNLIFTIGCVAVAGYLAGVWQWQAWRDNGRTLIYMKDSVRRCAAGGIVSKTNETSTSRLPGLLLRSYSGFNVKMPPIGSPDRSVSVHPLGSEEILNDRTVLIYSPTSPLINARALKSVMSFFANSMEANTGNSFKMDKKSTSEVRFGLLNSLTTTITTEDLMRQERLINNTGVVADLIEDSVGGRQTNQDKLTQMIRIVKRKSPMEKAKSFVFGTPRTDTENDKPSQREPTG